MDDAQPVALNKPGWARPVWAAMLVLAMRADGTPSDGVDTFVALLEAWAQVLPCALCATHFKQYMADHPVAATVAAGSCVQYVHGVKAAVAERSSAPFRPSVQDSHTHAAHMLKAWGGAVVAQALYTMHTAARVDNARAWEDLLRAAGRLQADLPALQAAATEYAANPNGVAVRDVLLRVWAAALRAPGATHAQLKAILRRYAFHPRSSTPWSAQWSDDWFMVRTQDLASQPSSKALSSGSADSTRTTRLVMWCVGGAALVLVVVVVCLYALRVKRRRRAVRTTLAARQARARPTPKSYRVQRGSNQ